MYIASVVAFAASLAMLPSPLETSPPKEPLLVPHTDGYTVILDFQPYGKDGPWCRLTFHEDGEASLKCDDSQPSTQSTPS